jgi:hypothetical protein
MKRYAGIISVTILGVVIVAAGGYRKYRSRVTESERDANSARIQREYLERVGWIRSNPDEKIYKDEVKSFFRWYFQEIKDHLERFHGNTKFDDYLVELERKREGGSPDASAEKRAYYEYTKKVFDEFRSGLYAPAWSGTDQGMRLDVRTAEAQTLNGKRQIRLDLALWGAQRELRDDHVGTQGINVGPRKRMITSASFTMTWKMMDGQGKLIGELLASGDPTTKVDFPERFVAEFPPQMVLGYYAMDPIPNEVSKIDIGFNVISHSPSGGTANANYHWQLDAPSEWKLRPGEKWEGAVEAERPVEEIDPTAAAKIKERRARN